MAEVDYKVTYFGAGSGVRLVTWEGLTGSDTGKPYTEVGAKYADKCVQVTGTFDGSTVTIEGSNDYPEPSSYTTLSDIFGSAMSFTASGLKQVAENPLNIRPKLVNGSANTSIKVVICMRS